MMVFGLLGIVLLVGAILVFAREGSSLQGLFGSSQSNRLISGIDSVNALDILNQRYARGEITREQYQSMKQDLE